MNDAALPLAADGGFDYSALVRMNEERKSLPAKDAEPTGASGDGNAKRACALLKYIRRADDYHEWIRVGMALKAVGK